MMPDPDPLILSAREILARLVVVGKNVAVYPPKHPMVNGPAEDICEILKSLVTDHQQITFNILNSEIYVEKHLLREESLKYSDFIQLLIRREVNSLSFELNVAPESIAGFLSLINGGKEPGLTGERLKDRMKEEGITEIHFEKLIALDLAEDIYELVDEESVSTDSRASYDQALDCMKSVEQDVLANRPINAEALHMVASSLMEDFLGDREAMIGIMSIKSYDEYLFHHSVNVAITSLLIASKLGLDENQMKTVGVGGLLHDIGKLKIPREIINKPGRLSENEWIVMKRHPIEGAQILMRYEALGDLPVLAALEHQACYDLSGYPTLKGKEHPHVLARIISIADVYEAMTANRSYRPAQSMDKAIRFLIQGSGKQFDPLLVKLFLNTIGVFPPGSVVRLKSGDVAMVVEPNEDQPFLPRVRTIRHTSEDPGDGPVINTSEDPSTYAVAGVADSEKI